VYLPVEPGFSPLDQARWPADKVILQDRIFTEEQAKQRPELKLSRVADPRKLIPPALNVILARHPTTVRRMLVQTQRLASKTGGSNHHSAARRAYRGDSPGDRERH
jgi:hypothetical protein